jgi:hypothetical protein
MSVTYQVIGASSTPPATGKAEREVGRSVRSPVLKARLRQETVARLRQLIEALEARNLSLPGDEDAERIYDRFIASYARRPMRDNAGGTMHNSSFWVFATAALLRPPLIVESGTYLGQSSWMMAEASPDSRIVTFDIVRERLRAKDPRVAYRLGDWSDDPEFRELPDGALIYFDDHISHRRRIEETVARGGALALLDDDMPGHALYATGAPPVPTRAMMQDADLPPGTRCEWERNGKVYAYDYTKSDAAAGRRHIAWSTPMPDLTPVNLYVPQSPMTLIGLRAETESEG